MSVGARGEQVFTGRSAAADPADAVREALSALLRDLGAAGGAPHHLAAMRWEVGDPGAFHPSRRAIELASREVLGGFRPASAIAQAPSPGGPGLVATARAILAAPPSGPLWEGFTAAELAREYGPRSQVPDMGALFARWTRDGTAFRAARHGLDLRYGGGPAETLDLFRPDGAARPPVWVFVHGGYWQASTKEQHAQFAAGMLAAGFAVAMVEYGLLPETPLAGIVSHVVAALRFLAGEADALGVDAGRMHLAGHSAGGHLAAMAALDPSVPPVRSALLLSGLFDLAPLAHLPVGGLFGAAPADLAALSPIHRAKPPGLRVGVALGGAESPEFKRQSALIAGAWDGGPVLEIPGENHFDLLEGLRRDGPLLALARGIADA